MTDRMSWASDSRVTDGRGPLEHVSRTAGIAACATAALLAIAPPAAASAASASATHEAAEAGRWSFAIALVGLGVVFPLLVLVVGGIFTGFRDAEGLLPWRLIRGAIVGHDNRVSTSKTVAVVWTYAVASALLSLVIAKWMGHGGALDRQNHNGLQSNYALLVGGPLGAAILAKAVVASQVSAGAASKPAGEPAASQLVTGDTGATDLGDLQYVLFSVVALVFFFGEFLRAPYNGFPDLPDLLVGLTSLSAVGYLGKKVIAQPPAIVKVDPPSPKPRETIRIYGSGLVVDDNPPSDVYFDDHHVPPAGVELTPDGPAVRVDAPAAGEYRLAVKTAKGLMVTWDEKLTVVAEGGTPTT
jgi:hypothetical protein